MQNSSEQMQSTEYLLGIHKSTVIFKVILNSSYTFPFWAKKRRIKYIHFVYEE